MKQILMCNSWAFCIYQTLLKNSIDNQINQIKNLIKLFLRLFCHVMTLSCKKGKNNMITKRKKLAYNSLLRTTASSAIFLWWLYETFYLNQKFVFKYSIWELTDLDQKNLCRGGLRELPNMPKLWISLKPLALTQNSNNIKKNSTSTHVRILESFITWC